jgi:hypothetical protein
VTVTRECQPPARLLYVVAEADEDAAMAIVRRRSRAVQNAVVESLGPITKAEVKRRRQGRGCATALMQSAPIVRSDHHGDAAGPDPNPKLESGVQPVVQPE